jgi:hypothetical protein
MKFKIGQPVTYVGPVFLQTTIFQVPAYGKIYRIRGGCLHPCSGEPCYVVEEIRNPEMHCTTHNSTLEPHFHENFFRALQERKNDGAAFVESLRKVSATGGGLVDRLKHMVERIR